MNTPSEDALDQVIGRSGRREPFHLAELPGSLEAFLTDEKLAALKYRRVWAATQNAVGYLPLEAPENPWAPKVLSQWVATRQPLRGEMGAPLARARNPQVLSVGSRVVARMPDALPITLEWGQVSKQRHLFFDGLFVGVLRARGRSIPVREQLSVYGRTATERDGQGEFECSALASMVREAPPLALGAIKQPEWAGWVGVYFSANESLMAEPGTPAESVWSSYFAELLVKGDLSEAIFAARYNVDASA